MILGKFNSLCILIFEDKMVGWHHRLSGLECEQVPGDGEGQESQLVFIEYSIILFFYPYPQIQVLYFGDR